MSGRLEYTCGKCARLIPHTAWTVTVRPDGKLSFIASCHGETEERIISLDMGGVMFAGSGVAAMEVAAVKPSFGGGLPSGGQRLNAL